jgi:hypothetical protein
MRNRPLFRAAWSTTNLLVAASLAALLYGAGWEYSTRRYLKGFADAVVPVNAAPEQKIEAILEWMHNGPRRAAAANPDALDTRDPQNTLNYRQLLNFCGSATNAFINVAISSDLQVRRLLLLTPSRTTKHVVAEVLVEGRWVVVDPAFHALFRDAHGRLLTRQDLRAPAVLAQAAQSIPNYPTEYTYENFAQVRLERVPLAGAVLHKALDFLDPNWEEAFNWSLLLERESYTLLMSSLVIFCIFLGLRLVLAWYGDHKLGFSRVRLREQLARAGMALLSSPR